MTYAECWYKIYDSFGKEFVADYTNFRGKRSVRRIVPLKIGFGSSKYHPGDQWLLYVRDLDKDLHREFAVKNINSLELSQ
jgi:hypothetical protein